MKKLPKVTIAIVCLNEEKNIADCLISLLGQSYPPEKTEILVVNNASTDHTQEIIKNYQKETKRIRLVINPKRGIAASRNVAVRECKTKLIVFTDADCVAPKQWLKRLIRGYLKYKPCLANLVAVGGPNYPPSTIPFYQALGLMLNTFLGSRGSVQGRRYPKDREVPHLPCVNVLYEKEAIEKIGGFDESFVSIIEDEDLSYRLSQKRYQFVYLAGAGVTHKMRDNFWAWTKNMFIYGKGRMWFLKKHPGKIHLFFLLPLVLVITAPLSLWFYLPLVFFYSLWLGRRAKKLNLWYKIFSLFFLTHWAYGVGEIYGIFKPRGEK